MRLNCYDVPSEDEKFDALFELRARPIVLGSNTAIADGELFEKAAEKIFLMDSQLRDVLRRLIEAARIHGESHLGLDRDYIAGLHKTQKNPWGTEFPTAICLASHAGVGKSQLLRALERVLGQVVVGSVEGVRGIAHRGVWSLSIRDGTGWNAILGVSVR